jgi:Cu-Zn family superoxide dismutase
VTRYPLPGDNVFPEGITEGPDATFFVGSMGDGTIYRGDTTTGEVEVFLPPDGDGRTMVTGLAVDGHGRLIACDFDGRQIFVYRLDSRDLVARRSFGSEEVWPNDVAVAGDSAYISDSNRPLVWRLPAGPGGIGEPEVAIDLTPFGVADPAFCNGIVAHPAAPLLLVASQGEGGVLWQVDLTARTAAPVDLGGYEFNADGMLLDAGMLYGVVNRGETIEDLRFAVSAARLDPGWHSGTIVGELADPDWDCPTTIAQVAGKLLVVCSQVRAMRASSPPHLPFEVAAADFPGWR